MTGSSVLALALGLACAPAVAAGCLDTGALNGPETNAMTARCRRLMDLKRAKVPISTAWEIVAKDFPDQGALRFTCIVYTTGREDAIHDLPLYEK